MPTENLVNFKKRKLAGSFGQVPILRVQVLSLLNKEKYGMRASIISKRLSVPSRTIRRCLKELQDMGLIKNVFPVWFPLDKLSETGQVQGDPLKSASATTQLHNLRFVIKLVDKPKWWDRRRDRIMKLHDYDVKNVLWGNYRFLQLRREQFIVQIHKDSICVIMTESYWGDSPYDCFEKGVKDFLSVYRFIEAHFDFKFFKSGVPQVVVSSKDYVNLRDAVVGECKRLKDKFGVWIDNELVLWVDLSVPLGVESHQIESMSVYQDYVQDILKNKPPRPSQLAEDLRDAQNQISYLSMLIMSPDDENESLPEYIG